MRKEHSENFPELRMEISEGHLCNWAPCHPRKTDDHGMFFWMERMQTVGIACSPALTRTEDTNVFLAILSQLMGKVMLQ